MRLDFIGDSNDTVYMFSILMIHKTRYVTAHLLARAPRLLDQLRECLRLHYSLRTEQTCLYRTR